MFNPTYRTLDERQPWENTFYNTTIAELITFLANINGTELAVPFALSRSGQHLDGGDHDIHSFRKWLGYGSADVCIRDVTGYGAKGDGSTDDMLAIQAAIDDLPTTGGIIVFPPGTYKITDTIKMVGTARNKVNVTLAGFGPSSIIKRVASSLSWPMIEMGATETGASGQTLMALAFDGNNPNQTGTYTQTCVSMVDTVGAKILFCSVYDAYTNGITVYGSTDGLISCCRVYNCTANGIGQGSIERTAKSLTVSACRCTGNGASGIALGPLNDGILGSNLVSDNTVDGIRIESRGNLSSEGIEISGGTAKNNGGNGVSLLNENPASSITNVVVNAVVADSNGSHGINVSGLSGCLIRRFTLNGNQATRNTSNGINILGNVKYGSLTGNIGANNLGAADNGGIVVQGLSADEKVMYLSIVGNGAFYDGIGTVQRYGILMMPYTDSCAVTANAVGSNSVKNVDDRGDNDIAHNAGF